MSTILRALRKAPTAPATGGGLMFSRPDAGAQGSKHSFLTTTTTIALLGLLVGAGAGHIARYLSRPTHVVNAPVMTAPAIRAAADEDAVAALHAAPQHGGTRTRQQPAPAEDALGHSSTVPPTASSPESAHPGKRSPVRRRAKAQPERPRESHSDAIVGPFRPTAPAVATQRPAPPHSEPAIPTEPARQQEAAPSGSGLELAAATPADSPPATEPAAAPLPLFQEPVMVDGGASIQVVGGQRVTIKGEATSLRSVVEELCRQSGIELRSYAAADRRYVAHHRNLPLSDVFRSMFRNESYLVGLTYDEFSREKRITWIQVLGTKNGPGQPPVAAQAAGSPPPPTLVRPTPAAPQKFVLSPTLLYEAFGTMDPARREQAQREALERLMEPAQRAVFLSADTIEVANVMANYEHAGEGVRAMKRMTDLPDLQAKLDEIMGVLGEPMASDDE